MTTAPRTAGRSSPLTRISAGWSQLQTMARPAWTLALLTLVVAIGLAAPARLLPAITIMVIYVPAALGLALLLGHAGQLSLGQGALVGTGAYATAVLVGRYDVDHVLALALAMVFTVVVAAVASPVLRLSGLMFVLATLALNFVLITVFENANAWTGGPSGFTNTGYALTHPAPFGFTLETPLRRYLMVVVVSVLAYVFCRNVVRGRAGTAYFAIASDEDAARAVGIPTLRVKVTLWLTSAALASVSGSLLVFYTRFAAPDQFDLGLSALLVASVIAGGSGSLGGPVAALAVVTLPTEIVPALRDWSVLAFGVLIIAVLAAFPEGLRGLASRWRRVPTDRPDDVVDDRSFQTARRPVGPPSDDPILAADGIRVSFGGLVAVTAGSLQVRPGEILGLIGPNGAGKTTMVNAMTGVVTAEAGTVTFKGQSLEHLPAATRASHGLRRTFQNVRLVEQLSVRDNVRLGAYSLGRASTLADGFALPSSRRDRNTIGSAADTALAEIGLVAQSHTPAGDLPAGVRRQVEVARAVATTPEVVILDEPAAGLNDVETEHLRTTIKDLAASGTAVILIEHDLDLVMRVCHRITVMHEGQVIAEGTPDAIRANQLVRDVYLGNEAQPEPDRALGHEHA